jgi:Bacterial Ig-like domain (group 3)/FG-GAP-like repeat/FG-GAP repeat
MLSKCAGSLLILLPVFVFAQLQVPSSSSRAIQVPSLPQVGSPIALPLPHSGPLGTGEELRRPSLSAWGKTRTRQMFGHPRVEWTNGPNRIFLTAPTYASGGYFAESVVAADVNGDGKFDLIVTNQCSDSACTNHGFVGVLLGNGDGTFQPVVTYNSGGFSAFSVEVADVNGDGMPDLVVANECASSDCTSGSVSVLLGKGDGTFQAAVSYGSGGHDAFSVAVKDVNGDSKPDLLVANYCADSNCLTDGSVGVLLGKGDGTFRAAVAYDSGASHAVSVAVGDVNGDGKPDLLVANYCVSSDNCATGSVGVLLGKGDGKFLPAVTYSSGGYEAQSVAVADVNADGKLDLLVANVICAPSGCATGSAGVLLGNGDGTFQPALTYDSGGFSAESVAVEDINGDGKPDLVVANTCVGNGGFDCQTGSVGVLLGNGDGTFQPPMRYVSGGTGASSVVVKDVNGDGNQDLLVANACGNHGNFGCMIGSVGVLLGNGNGTFHAAVNYTSGGYEPYSVAVKDVNGDGNPDLLVANRCVDNSNCNGVVGVRLGNGDGTLQPVVTYDSGGYEAQSVAVADVNGDGKPDLVVANVCADSNCTSGGVVGVLLGNGDGTFQAAISYGSGGLVAESVAVADVSGDGKPDLVVANGDGSVGVLMGNGDGSFQAAVSYGSGGASASSLAVADVSRDGKLDLVVANFCASSDCANGSVGVLLGNGDGTFQGAVTYSSGGLYTGAVELMDLNGDSKLDVVVASEYVNSSETNGSVGVLLGNGDGTFQAPLITSTPTPLGGVRSLALADFNGDGKVDLALSAGNFLLLGNGDGTFQTPKVLGAGGTGIAVGDFNRDGRPDLAVGGVTVLLNISAFPTTTTITSSSNPSTFGQSVTFSATVTPKASGMPTGTVTFREGSTILGTSPLNGGTAQFSTAALTVGHHCIRALYSGDTSFAASTSPELHQVVHRATTTITLDSSLNPSTGGMSVTFTATVVPQYSGTPAGTVTFKNGSTIMGKVQLTSGQAVFTKLFKSPGTKSVTAFYSGNANFMPSSAELTDTF